MTQLTEIGTLIRYERRFIFRMHRSIEESFATVESYTIIMNQDSEL